jgi:hypothetical protein
MKIGILEHRDNEFMAAVVSRLSGIDAEYIRVAEIPHPTPAPYPLVVDRLSFCDPFLREVMRYWALGGSYIINNPYYTLTSDKLSEARCCDSLGIPTPKTMLLPSANNGDDLEGMVGEPDWERVTREMPLPCIIKPVDGYAWQDVFRAETLEELRGLHESLKGRRVLIVQELVRWVSYCRAFCIGGEVLIVAWDPKPFDLGVYSPVDNESLMGLSGWITEKTAALNGLLGLDFNSVEWCVTADGRPCVIDSYNDVPDVRPGKLPPREYEWIVERFSALIRDRLASGARNNPRIAGLE